MNGTRVCCKFENYDKSGQASTNFSEFITCFIISQHWVLVSCVDTNFRYDIFRILRYGTRVCCKFRNYDKSGRASTDFSQFITCYIFSEYWVLVLCVDTNFRYSIFRIFGYGTRVCCNLGIIINQVEPQPISASLFTCYIFSEYWVLDLCVDTNFR